MILWTWSDGVATLKDLKMYSKDRCTNTDPEKLILTQSKTGCTINILCLTLSQSYRTLGAWVAADGNQRKQYEILQSYLDRQIEAAKDSSFQEHNKQLAYSSFLSPQIVYPMGCTTLDYLQLKILFWPVLDALLLRLGLNKKLPLAMVHFGPYSLGLGINDFPANGVAQLQLLLGHLNMRD